MPSDLGGFMTGFEQGYGFMQDMAARRENRRYRQERLEAQKKQQSIENTRTDETLQLRKNMAKREEERYQNQLRRQRQTEFWLAQHYAATHGGITAKTWDGLTADIDAPSYQHMTSPEMGEAIDGLPRIATGEVGYSSPQVQKWLNTLGDNSIQKGVGEVLPDGATISHKKIVATVPMPDGGVGHDLEIEATRPDGTKYRYSAPMTEGRNADPNAMVSSMQPGAYMGAFSGAKQVRHLLMGMTPEQQAQYTARMAIMHGVDPKYFEAKPQSPQWGAIQQFGKEYVQRNLKTGAYRKAPLSAYGLTPPSVEEVSAQPPSYYTGGKHSPASAYSAISRGIGDLMGGGINQITGTYVLPGESAPIVARLTSAAEEAWKADIAKNKAHAPAWYVNRAYEAYASNPKDYDAALKTAFQPTAAAKPKLTPTNMKKGQAKTSAKSPQSSASAKTASAKTKKYVNGAIYVDASGNRARYENGKWIPVNN